jgi:hypothetical protein
MRADLGYLPVFIEVLNSDKGDLSDGQAARERPLGRWTDNPQNSCVAPR